MKETLKMMESILTGKEGKVNEKELIKEYQEKLSPNILAYFYVNNYGVIYTTSKIYKNLIDDDKASFCLQELDKCLQNFDLHKNNKFITYFMKCYKNRLRAENESLYMQKRRVIMNCSDLDDIQIIDEALSDELENIGDTYEKYGFTDVEKIQCRLLNIGYTLKEISKILKVAEITTYKRNSKIKQKILNYNINCC